MIRRSFLIALLIALLVAFSDDPLASAVARTGQDAFPTEDLPVTPAPAECHVEPRGRESLAAILGTPVAAGAPAAEAQSTAAPIIEVPIGQPAGGDVEAGITATVQELYACFNAGDLRRAFALATDRFLRGFVAEESLTAWDIAFFLAEPEPVPAEARTALLAITDVSVLADGRAGAFVVSTNPLTGPDTVYMVFVRQGEPWLVDDIIGFLEE